MLPLQNAATDLPAALFLFGFVNRVFQGPHHQIWNRNCSLISLEAGWRGVSSLHYAACFPVSASSFTPLHFKIHYDINAQSLIRCVHIRIHPNAHTVYAQVQRNLRNHTSQVLLLHLVTFNCRGCFLSNI